jgi:hypothetical protein
MVLSLWAYEGGSSFELNELFQFSFNSSLKADFQGSRVTTEAGLNLVRRLGKPLGFSGLIEQHLTDSRTCCGSQCTAV